MVKIEKLFFYLLIFCLPFQTRLIIKQWGAEFNEWNSAFLYFTDLLIFAILLFWIYRGRLTPIATPKNAENIVLGLFFAIAGSSLFKTQNLGLGAYQFIKMAEFIILFFYIKSNRIGISINEIPTALCPSGQKAGPGMLIDKIRPSPFGKRAAQGEIGRERSERLSGFKKLFRLESICLILMVSGLFQVALGSLQFAHQQDLGLKIFGESPLHPNIDGVAKIVVLGAGPAAAGVKMIRAYGTFPHPNVLAAFLLFSIFSFYFLYLRMKEPTFCLKLMLASIFVFLVFGLFLTFSRTLITLFFIFSIALFLWLFFKKSLYNFYRRKTIMLCSFFLLAVLLCVGPMFSELYSRFVINAVDPGISLRYFYNFISFSMLKENPVLGVGIGNFVWGLNNFQGSLRAANLIYKLDVPETEVIPYVAPSWLFQPVHNVFLLIATEIGILGLLIFLIFLGFIIYPVIKIIKENNPLFIVYCLLFIVIAAAMTDHFFWTIQQGRLMFWILAGILAGLNKKTS